MRRTWSASSTRSTIVLDASAIVAAMLTQRAASRLEAEVGEARPCAPEVVDVEVLSSLRRLVRRGELPEDVAGRLLLSHSRSTVQRVPHATLLPVAWTLRKNLTASDATYVALARSVGARLITSDARLAGAPGLGIPVTVLPTG
jgi:predicted nucleic acid-binding protein